MRKLATYFVCLVLFFAPLASCLGPMSQAQGVAMKTEISKQMDAGDISEELGIFLLAEINKRMDPNYSGDLDWDLILKSGGGIALAVIGSLTGIRLQRGPAKKLDKSQADVLQGMIANYQEQGAASREDAS